MRHRRRCHIPNAVKMIRAGVESGAAGVLRSRAPEARRIDAATDVAAKSLTLALAQALHRDPRVERRCSDAHSSARCFHSGGCGLEIGIPLHGVRNERVQLRVAEIADPVRHHGATAMRAGPASRDFRASRLRHDVRAKGRIFQSAARKHEAAGGNKKQGAAPSVHRLILSVRRRERRDV